MLSAAGASAIVAIEGLCRPKVGRGLFPELLGIQRLPTPINHPPTIVARVALLQWRSASRWLPSFAIKLTGKLGNHRRSVFATLRFVAKHSSPCTSLALRCVMRAYLQYAALCSSLVQV